MARCKTKKLSKKYVIFNIAHALGELAVMYPIPGGFYSSSNRFIDPAWGFCDGTELYC